MLPYLRWKQVPQCPNLCHSQQIPVRQKRLLQEPSLKAAYLPEPTVRLPPWYLNSVFVVFSMLFIVESTIKSLFLRGVFLFAWFLGTVLAPKYFLLIHPYYIVIVPCNKNINKGNSNSLFSGVFPYAFPCVISFSLMLWTLIRAKIRERKTCNKL